MEKQKMTQERARFLIVSALSEVGPADIQWTGGVIATFHAEGLATDDDVTTWRDVFAAANFKGWELTASVHADASEAR